MTLTSCFVDLRFCKLKGGTPEHTRTVWLQYTVHAYIERQYTWSGGGVPEVMLHAVFLHTTFPEVASVRPTSCSMLSRRHGLGDRPLMCIHLSLKTLSCQTFLNTTCHDHAMQANDCSESEPSALYLVCFNRYVCCTSTHPSPYEHFSNLRFHGLLVACYVA